MTNEKEIPTLKNPFPIYWVVFLGSIYVLFVTLMGFCSRSWDLPPEPSRLEFPLDDPANPSVVYWTPPDIDPYDVYAKGRENMLLDADVVPEENPTDEDLLVWADEVDKLRKEYPKLIIHTNESRESGTNRSVYLIMARSVKYFKLNGSNTWNHVVLSTTSYTPSVALSNMRTILEQGL